MSTVSQRLSLEVPVLYISLYFYQIMQLFSVSEAVQKKQNVNVLATVKRFKAKQNESAKTRL